jgi:hypothetical protein
MLELVGLVLAAPGTIAALAELRAQHGARLTARLPVTELDFSVRPSIRRMVSRRRRAFPFAASRPERRLRRITERSDDTRRETVTVQFGDELASDAEALARVEGKSLDETVERALSEAVQRRRGDPKFRARVRRMIKEDRELLERLAE